MVYSEEPCLKVSLMHVGCSGVEQRDGIVVALREQSCLPILE